MKPETTQTSRGVEPEVVERLVSEHGPAVLGYLVKFCGNRQDAEDCFQETFRRFVEKGQTVNVQARKNWLYRVATNVALDGHRASCRHPKRNLESGPDGNREMQRFEPEDRTPGPADRVTENEQTQVVRQAIVALPEKQRVVLILSYYQKQSYREIAEFLHCSVSTVKTHMSRALASLATRLPDPG